MPTSTSSLLAPSASLSAADVKVELLARASAEGFAPVGIAHADAAPQTAARLAAFLTDGFHGQMHWMAETAARRGRPRALWPAVRSIVLCGFDYAPQDDPMALLGEPDKGAISVYARGKDYHDIIKPKLKRLAGWLHRETGAGVKVFVDTAPVMEKPLAEAAGVGWQGKHTNLVSRVHGSWLFIGSIFTEFDLPPDLPESDHCGSCRACLEICPTNAFPAPYRLDARRCISYLTIEHKGHIDEALRAPMGNRVFGCDDCLAVCPWNKFAQEARDVRLAGALEARGPALAELLALDDAAFRHRFRGTPVKRIGRDRFVRNVLIAAGNSGERSLLPAVEAHLGDHSPLVRAMAVWASARLHDAPGFARLAKRLAGAESDPHVRREWERPLQ